MYETERPYMPRAGVDAAAFDEGLRSYMLGIYNYMASAVALSGIVAFLVASSPAVSQLLFTTPLKWVVVLAPLGFVMLMSFSFERLSKTALLGLFWAFAALMGASLASILLVYTGASVARAFFVTAGMFAGVSIYGYTTKADLTKFSTFLMMGLFGLIIAGLVNMFVQSSMMQFVISAASVLVFCGLTAWDTQRLKDTYIEAAGTEIEGKLSVMGALSLYLNFVNLFIALVQLFGNRRD
ncbi:MAG: BAX inhibitor (BI)-1/YccA family protein [Alphaproteobacteria bacterium]|nr:BAX inhibitor (BI)-1/YccA family protein [Alphaproteobacteria bacterium]